MAENGDFPVVIQKKIGLPDNFGMGKLCIGLPFTNCAIATVLSLSLISRNFLPFCLLVFEIY